MPGNPCDAARLSRRLLCLLQPWVDEVPANAADWRMRGILRAMRTRHVAVNALRIALFVGTALNLINQGGAILSGSGVSWVHLVLNYAVPYCVASYSAAKNQTSRNIDRTG